jgi:hypothetical protein
MAAGTHGIGGRGAESNFRLERIGFAGRSPRPFSDLKTEGMLMRESCPWARLSGMRTGRALTLIVTLTVGIFAAPVAAGAQKAGKVARLGILHPRDPATSSHFAAAFDQGLESMGIRNVKASWWNAQASSWARA